MKVLFAVSNENISEAIIKKYQQMYKEIISSKNVYYFNAILKELQKDKTYDRIVISEDLEPLTNKNYEAMDNGLFEKLDLISDEASDAQGENIPVIVISTDRRAKGENMLVRLFGIGIYDALIGDDRSVEQVCNLISKPRSKKEAKIYYKIASNEVIYKPETEDVSEVEIQNILAHYKRLGKNTEKYVDSFMSISNQYTDAQLKIIIQFLPLGVKAVLESECAKYQELMTSSGVKLKKAAYVEKSDKKAKEVKEMNEDNGIKSQFIEVEDAKKLTRPVIIPSELKTREIVKPEIRRQPIQNKVVESSYDDMFEDIAPREEVMPVQKVIPTPIIMEEEVIVEPVKKGRGRPKKEAVEVEEKVETTTGIKRRGRPKKIVEESIEETVLPGFDEETETMLPGFGGNNQEETMLPGFEENNQEETMLPGFGDNEPKVTMPRFEEELETALPGFEEEDIMPGFREEAEDILEPRNEQNYNQYQTEENLFDDEPVRPTPTTNYNAPAFAKQEEKEESIVNYGQSSSIVRDTMQSLVTGDKKIVGFVGTSKNGVSFLVNNVAQMLSTQGIKVAILDLTKNKNSYYIYTRNEEELRKLAAECMDKLVQGIAQGVPANKNLDVYTTIPGEEQENLDETMVLKTLLQNYSLVLVDCDFNSEYNYIEQLQELYLVQNMDVLTIQPLTAYLRDLKAKGILQQEKLRIVINQYVKVRSISEKTIIGGMAFYNDPAMSYMSELFNRETIKYMVIPYEVQTYARYLEGLVNCDVTLERYSKTFIAELRKLANMVYPLIPNTNGKGKNEKQKSQINQYQNSYGKNFSNMNDTLDRMKKYQ